MTVGGLALTFWRGFPRVWKVEAMGILLATAFIWIWYVTRVDNMPADFGYVGLILIQTFAFSIIRLPFGLVAIFDVVTMPAYLALAQSSASIGGVQTILAIFYLGSFGLLGLIVSYLLEWKIRKLYVRERQLDRERDRSDALLLNILPQAIIDRLKAQGDEGDKRRVAEGLDDVTVLFADAVGFTVQAAKTSSPRSTVSSPGSTSSRTGTASRRSRPSATPTWRSQARPNRARITPRRQPAWPSRSARSSATSDGRRATRSSCASAWRPARPSPASSASESSPTTSGATP
jgi:hypothetical protein